MVGFNYGTPISGRTAPKEESIWERNQRILQERKTNPPVPATSGGEGAGMLSTAGIAPAPPVSGGGLLGTGTKFMDAVRGAQQGAMDTGRFPYASAGGPYVPSREEVLAMMFGSGGGGGASRPDFSAYRAALTEQAQGLNAQIQAMYNALAGEAGANVGRIQEIYGGAGEGINAAYDSSAGNVQQAYESSSQQAADQMARLGIEAAAPAVLNPMALSQAQAVSQLEQGRAGGLSANERYGSAASGFGSQMGQVAQQQGTEMNAAILGSLQRMLAESLAAEQTGGGGGGGGGGGRSMSLKDQIAFEDFYKQNYLGEVPLDERKFAYEVAQGAAGPLNEWVNESTRRFMETQFPKGSRVKPEEYLQAEEAARKRYRQQVGLE
jgi:hypothetical protein